MQSTVYCHSGSQIARARAPCAHPIWCSHGVRARAMWQPLWRQAVDLAASLCAVFENVAH
eukprot:4723658-Lingulodinium_polyedra.AAC.1